MRSLLAASLLGLALVVACSAGSSTTTTAPVTSGQVVGPTTQLTVTVALASAHLGADKCTHDESKDVATKACATPAPDSGAPVGTGLCGGPCDFSSINLALTAGASGAASRVQVTGAAILDGATGAELQKLTASTPLSWDGAAYVAWNETVAPSASMKVSYTLSPPTWSAFDPQNQYSRAYKVRVDVTVDGAKVTLESAALHRDPPVAT